MSENFEGRSPDLPEGYDLPGSYTASFRLIREGVADEAVKHFERHFLRPILASNDGLQLSSAPDER